MLVTYYSVPGVGILTSWPAVEEALKGLPNPVFKSFRTLPAAEAYLSGWDAGTPTTDNTPWGFAGPQVLPPTPSHKLGLPFSEHIARKFAAPSSAAINPPSGGSSSQSSKSRQRPQPVPSTQGAPVPGPSRLQAGSPDPLGFRRRSPLIQIVVEEEDEDAHQDELTPPSSAGSEHADSDSPARSRAGSVSTESSPPSLGKRRKSGLGLGLGNMLSLSPVRPLTPPLSPETASQRSVSSSSADTASEPSNSGGPHVDVKPKSRFSSWLGSPPTTASASLPASSSHALPVAKVSAAAVQPSRSLWAESPVSSPLPSPVSQPVRPSYSPDTTATSPTLTPFTDDSAPVFSRSSSSGPIILPLRSPASSTTSLHRPRSIQSLRNAPSSTSLHSMSSSISGLRSPGLEPPRLGRYGSALSNAGGSNDSLASGWDSAPSSAAASVVRLDEQATADAEIKASGPTKKAKGKGGGGWLKKMKSKVFGDGGGLQVGSSA